MKQANKLLTLSTMRVKESWYIVNFILFFYQIYMFCL